jgi:hypothetical protein
MPHIEPGTYRATATNEFNFQQAKTGSQYLRLYFRLIDNPEVTIGWSGFFTEKTQARTLEALRACGWRGDDLSQLSFPAGNEVLLVIEDEEYEGKLHSRVAFVNSIRGPSVKNAMAPQDLKMFAARMKGAIVAFDQAQKAAGVQAPPAPIGYPSGGGAGAGEDIPFGPFSNV